MKVWELESACRSNPEAWDLVSGDSEWQAEYELVRAATKRINGKWDRQKLDTELPDAFCRKVLTGVSNRYREYRGYIRTAGFDPTVGELSAVDVFDRFGGSFLEDVNEAGLAEIPRP